MHTTIYPQEVSKFLSSHFQTKCHKSLAQVLRVLFCLCSVSRLFPYMPLFNQIHFPNPKLNPRLKNLINQGPPPYQLRFIIKITGKHAKFTKNSKLPHSVTNQPKVSKLNPHIRTHIPHTQNYFASCKTNNHPTTPILRPPPRPKYAHSTNG